MSIYTSSQTGRTPTYRLVLTGKSFFVLNRKDVDVEKLNIRTGDIVLFCIRCKISKDREHYSGQIRGLVCDGRKLRHVYLSMFMTKLGFNNKIMLKEVVANISRLILTNKDNEVLYDRYGYYPKLSTCHRCGYCCIKYSVSILRPDFVKYFDGKDLQNEMIIFKHGNVPCPHLLWDKHHKAVCKIHHYSWFQSTPCNKHNWEGSSFQCDLWVEAEKTTTREGTHWDTRYYQGYNIEEYGIKFYELNERAKKEGPLEFLRKLFT